MSAPAPTPAPDAAGFEPVRGRRQGRRPKRAAATDRPVLLFDCALDLPGVHSFRKRLESLDAAARYAANIGLRKWYALHTETGEAHANTKGESVATLRLLEKLSARYGSVGLGDSERAALRRMEEVLLVKAEKEYKEHKRVRALAEVKRQLEAALGPAPESDSEWESIE